jgi:hypothetical protein
MTLLFGVFDHIEPVPGLRLDRIYLMHAKDGSFGFVGERPAGRPTRETRRDIEAEPERFSEQKHRPYPNRIGGVALAGAPTAVRECMDEYIATGANYFVCSFQWGDLTHEQAMRSIDLFATEVMPHYASAVGSTR